MNSSIPHLLELQRLDHQIASLRAELDTFPKRIREADAMLSGARAGLAAAREKHSHAQSERKKFELDVNQWREKARKYRDQSASVKTNEAYKALQHEITHAETQASAAEDRQLEQMMLAEESERDIKAAQIKLQEAEQALAGERKQIELQSIVKKQELAAILAEREKQAALVPEDLLDLYARIAKRHHGTAMAEAIKEQCRGCGMRILPHVYEELRNKENQEIYQCETCARLLYVTEPVVVPGASGAAEEAASSGS